MNDINNKLLSGAALMVLLRLCVKGIGLVSSIILVRLLVPEDFGLVALIMAIYAFIELLNAFGFDVALIQNQKATDEHYDTSWTIRLLFALLAALAMILLAEPMAGFYDDPRLVQLAYCLSLVFLVNGACNIGVVNFRKHLDFKKEFVFEATTKIVSASLTIVLAYWLRTYWALVFGILANAIIRLALSYWMNTYRPKFSLSKWRDLYKFSSWLLLNNVLAYLNNKSKDLLIGRFAGISQVGFYSVTDEFASLPTNEFVASVNRATFPGYSKVASNLVELKNLYLKVLASIAFIGIPSSIGIALIAPIFVPVVLGKDWIAAIPVLQLLSFANAFISVNTNVGFVFIAMGKPKYSTIVLSIRVCLLLSLMMWLLNVEGYIGAAKAVLLTSMIMFLPLAILLCKKLQVSLLTYLSHVIKPAFSSIVMYLATSYVMFGFVVTPTHLPEQQYQLVDLILCILLGGSIFILTSALIWLAQGKPLGPEQFVVDKIKLQLKRG